MTTLGDRTATELADGLDIMHRHRHNTGGLSMLDEATLAFGWKYEQIGPLQRAFAEARYAHMRSYRTETGNYSDEAWDRAMQAASALAAALRLLGDTRIARCTRPSKWGPVCDFPLEDDGTCRASGHLPAADAHGPGCEDDPGAVTAAEQALKAGGGK
jgi:hypothetical protein